MRFNRKLFIFCLSGKRQRFLCITHERCSLHWPAQVELGRATAVDLVAGGPHCKAATIMDPEQRELRSLMPGLRPSPLSSKYPCDFEDAS